ncbi:hypothetical protein N7451_012464 [Penicillium sp. IBT 35674x]|nr:hypothetical protein N7451_012464 [Penicillium sp. IBT 35674x]
MLLSAGLREWGSPGCSMSRTFKPARAEPLGVEAEAEEGGVGPLCGDIMGGDGEPWDEEWQTS